MEASDSPKVVRVGREEARYSGPEGEATFFAFGAMRAGEFVRRGGRMVEALDADTVEWAGDRAGEPMTESERSATLDGIRHWYRAQGIPYDLRLSSGAVEDETGAVRPGFRAALPRAEHSDGWRLTDLHQSPEYPDPDRSPPTVEYSGPEGTAEIDRSIEVREEVRHDRFRDVVEGVHYTVLAADTLHWTRTRSGEPMNDVDRERILSRIRSAYEEWGIGF